MSFFSRLFGAPEATKEVFKAAKDSLDSLWYTDEEKATDAMNQRTEARKVLLEWIKNSQGQNLSRRFLAVLITCAWLVFKAVGVTLSVAAVWIVDSSDKLKESSDVIDKLSNDMTPAVMLILGFYFAAPHMGKVAEAALAKFGKMNKNDR